MVILNLFPGGIVQMYDVLENGYWHARSLAFIGQPLMRTLEWMRLPGDVVFLLAGIVPAVLAAVTGWRLRNDSADTPAKN
jgi:nitric oxide reductase subunit B